MSLKQCPLQSCPSCPGEVKCITCGKELDKFAQVFCDERKPGNPKPWNSEAAKKAGPPLPKGWQWGGWLKYYLTKAGATKWRWMMLKAYLGLNPQCGCERRQAKLDAAGEWARRLLFWLASIPRRLFRRRQP